MRTKVPFVLAAIMAVACTGSGSSEAAIEDAPAEIVCTLSSQKPLGQLRSLCIISEGLFAANTFDSVLLFGSDGKLIREIGHQGRAAGEYVMPWCVRAHGSNLVVWDAEQLKFIEYDLDGNYLAQYQYDSALNDFRIDGDRIYIYTAGRRDESIIDILNISDGQVMGIGPASDVHKALSHSVCGMPVGIQDGQCLFAPKDRLEVFRYVVSEGKSETVGTNVSETFTVDESGNDPGIARSRKKLDAFLNASSRTVYVFCRDKSVYLVAMEGISERDENNRLSNDGRYYSLYRMDGKKSAPKHYHMGSMGSSSLFADYDGDLYYIVTEVDGMDEAVCLNKLSRKAYK